MITRRQFLEYMGMLGLDLLVSSLIPKEILANMSKSEDYKKIPWGRDEHSKKIIYLESRGNPNAYNKTFEARGLMQIRPIVLKEWNELNPENEIYPEELLIPEINIEVGEFYLDRIEEHYIPIYGLKPTIENRLAGWNSGVGFFEKYRDAKRNFHKLPYQTKKFIRDYKKL